MSNDDETTPPEIHLALAEKIAEQAEADRLELAYWRFDSFQGHQGGEYKLRPMSNRDAFKAAVREMLAKPLTDEEAYVQMGVIAPEPKPRTYDPTAPNVWELVREDVTRRLIRSPSPDQSAFERAMDVMADMRVRDELHRTRHCVPLQPLNGCSFLRDAYLHALEQTVHLRGLLAELGWPEPSTENYQDGLTISTMYDGQIHRLIQLADILHRRAEPVT